MDMNLLYSDCARRLPDELKMDLPSFIVKEVCLFAKNYGYFPDEVLVKNYEYDELLQQVDDPEILIGNAKIRVRPVRTMTPGHIQLFPYIRNRKPLIYDSPRSPEL